MSWSKTVPTSASYVYDLSSEIPNNWAAIDTILTKEHYPLTDGVSLGGRHRGGKTGVLLADTTTNVNALSATAASGSLAFDTTTGEGKLFLANQTPNFYPVHLYDRMCTYAVGTATIVGPYIDYNVLFSQNAAMSQTTTDRWSTLGVGNKWTTPSPGYYLVYVETTFTFASTTFRGYSSICHLNSGGTFTSLLSTFVQATAGTINIGQTKDMGLFNMAAYDYIYVHVGAVTSTGTVSSIISIHKVC